MDGQISVVVLCHTRELAFQIAHEYERFSKYLLDVKTAVFYGGVPITQNRETLKNTPPHILVGTPGRVLGLLREKTLKLDKVKHFVMDECDKMLEAVGTFRATPARQVRLLTRPVCLVDMRRDVQEIFKSTPHDKQVMMFSATLSKEIRPVCRKFCQDVRIAIEFEPYLLTR